MKQLKIAHLGLGAYPYSVKGFERLFADFSEQGFNAVMIEYEDHFPYETLSGVRSEKHYSPEDIRKIDAAARKHNLAMIPKGLSFSHCGYILNDKRFSHLNGGGGLNLLKEESAEIVIRSCLEIHKSHPDAKMIHLGGDEIIPFAVTPPELFSANLSLGSSRLYVDFVNKIAAALKKRGLTCGIWSDMLIRYPLAIDDLADNVVVFYWDYWGYGEKTPFLSIGGGCSDFFVLDRERLKREDATLEKTLRRPKVRAAWEIPVGHLNYYEKYLGLNKDLTEASSFPYAAWFSDKGVPFVYCMLPYPEKGSSFLPELSKRLPHFRGFIDKGKKYGAAGAMSCNWSPWDWPFVKTTAPCLWMITKLLEDHTTTDDALYEHAASHMSSGPNAAALKEYFRAGSYFEFNDRMDMEWRNKPFAERVAELKEAGWFEEDTRKAQSSFDLSERLLSGSFRDLPDASLEKFNLIDLRWRAKLQIGFADKAWNRTETRREGEWLKTRKKEIAAAWYPDDIAEKIADESYNPWLDAIG